MLILLLMVEEPAHQAMVQVEEPVYQHEYTNTRMMNHIVRCQATIPLEAHREYQMLVQLEGPTKKSMDLIISLVNNTSEEKFSDKEY